MTCSNERLKSKTNISVYSSHFLLSLHFYTEATVEQNPILELCFTCNISRCCKRSSKHLFEVGISLVRDAQPCSIVSLYHESLGGIPEGKSGGNHRAFSIIMLRKSKQSRAFYSPSSSVIIKPTVSTEGWPESLSLIDTDRAEDLN